MKKFVKAVITIKPDGPQTFSGAYYFKKGSPVTTADPVMVKWAEKQGFLEVKTQYAKEEEKEDAPPVPTPKPAKKPVPKPEKKPAPKPKKKPAPKPKKKAALKGKGKPALKRGKG